MSRRGLNPRVLTSFLMLHSFSVSAVELKKASARLHPRGWEGLLESSRLAFSSLSSSRIVKGTLCGEPERLCTFQPFPQSIRRFNTRHGGKSFRMLSGSRDRGQRGASRRDIRLFVADCQLELDAQVQFSDSQSHYLRKVMRVAEGSEVKVFDGSTGEWWCKIDSFGKKIASGTVTEQRREMVSEPDVWVVFAIVKGDAADSIVQKATELGATCIVPVITQRAVAKALRRERLGLIAMEAAEQCERLSPPPSILDAQPLEALLQSWPPERQLVLCDETSQEAPLKALANLAPGAPAAVLVGPEGGWSGEELELLRSQEQLLSVSLGPRILRADTAVMAALTLFQAARGDWQGSAA